VPLLLKTVAALCIFSIEQINKNLPVIAGLAKNASFYAEISKYQLIAFD
jgi:hypothetical protein